MNQAFNTIGFYPFDKSLKPITQQPISFKPFVGQEIEFVDITSHVHDIYHSPLADIAIIPISNGFRLLVYTHPIQ